MLVKHLRTLILISATLSSCVGFAQERIIIGIAGGSGSGKTTLAYKLGEIFSDEMILIQQDSYYRDFSTLSKEERERTNFDHPESLEFTLLRKNLIDLKKGQSISKPLYDFKEHLRHAVGEQVDSKPIIIVEGIHVLSIPYIYELFDLKVFIDTDDNLRILRRVERDVKERGRTLASVRDRYISHVKPMYQQFVYPSRAHADVVVSGAGENVTVVADLIKAIQARK